MPMIFLKTISLGCGPFYRNANRGERTLFYKYQILVISENNVMGQSQIFFYMQVYRVQSILFYPKIAWLSNNKIFQDTNTDGQIHTYICTQNRCKITQNSLYIKCFFYIFIQIPLTQRLHPAFVGKPVCHDVQKLKIIFALFTPNICLQTSVDFWYVQTFICFYIFIYLLRHLRLNMNTQADTRTHSYIEEQK